MFKRFFSHWPTIARVGVFLHLVEDNMAHLSLSGIQLWVSTYVSIDALVTATDHYTQMATVANTAVAGALHAVKRGQQGEAKAPSSQPSDGEGDET